MTRFKGHECEIQSLWQICRLQQICHGARSREPGRKTQILRVICRPTLRPFCQPGWPRICVRASAGIQDFDGPLFSHYN